MMGWRSALTVSTAFPLTLLMVLPLFNALGIPLHQISITGLIIALGLLIDNAIVSVDEYNQARQRGNSPSEAIEFTIRHLSVPLLASTSTTVLTFLPLVLMPGNAGEFVSTLGAGVILAIISSLFLSLSIVPAISGFLDTRWPRTLRGGGFWRNGLSIDWCSRAHRRALKVVLRRPVLGVVLGVALPVAGFLLSTQLVDQFFPPVNRNQFQIQLKLPTQSSLAETQRVVAKARDILHAHPEVVRSHWFVGEKPPRVFYNITITEDGSPRFASAFVDTRSAEHTRDLLPRLQKEMIAALPEALVLTLPFEQGPPIDSPIEVRIFGPDVRTLARLGEEIRLVLSRTQAVTFAEGTISTGQPKLVVTVDEDAARIAGFSLADIASQLGSSLDGVTGAAMIEGTEEVPVRVRISSEERTELARVAVSSLSAPDGSAIGDANARVPLDAIAKIDLVPSVATITRRNGERLNTIHAYLDPFALTGTSLADFKNRLEESGFSLPMGYRLEFGGESEGSGEALANLISVFGPLLVLMVSTLVLAFNSFRMALIIGLVGFLTVGCGLLAIWVCGYPLGFMAIIGTMGLIGISINDSIVVLAAIRAHERARLGDAEAIVNVVMATSRHIVSTTLTTIGGFMPLILWGGIFWPPLAVAVAGGMVGATILALYFVPPLYVLFHRKQGHRPAQVPRKAVQPASLELETI
jgi:multidrug efflux pump subunit AcrB